MDYSRIEYEEYQIYMSARCIAIVIYLQGNKWCNKINIQSVYSEIRSKIKPSCHYKFILPENIIILSVSSDDFLQIRIEVVELQMWNYSSYVYEE